jgi:chondroitin 4-sulfotransferase 11
MLHASIKSPLKRYRWYYDVRFAYWAQRNAIAPADRYPPEFLERRAIFIHVPKTAGNAVALAMFGKWSIDLGAHTPALHFRNTRPDFFRSAFKFTFVRHPVERFLSAYAFLRRGGMTAGDRDWSAVFLKDCRGVGGFIDRLSDARYRRSVLRYQHFRPQWIMLCGPERDLLVDFVGKQERLQRDYDLVRRRLGFGRSLDRVNTFADDDEGERLTRAETEFVHDLYRVDFQLLGY